MVKRNSNRFLVSFFDIESIDEQEIKIQCFKLN